MPTPPPPGHGSGWVDRQAGPRSTWYLGGTTPPGSVKKKPAPDVVCDVARDGPGPLFKGKRFREYSSARDHNKMGRGIPVEHLMPSPLQSQSDRNGKREVRLHIFGRIWRGRTAFFSGPLVGLQLCGTFFVEGWRGDLDD